MPVMKAPSVCRVMIELVVGRTYTGADSEDREAFSYFIIISNIFIWVEGCLVLLNRSLLVKPVDILSNASS